MTLRYSTDIRNAGLDARIERIGPEPLLRIFADPPPGSTAAPDPPRLLVEIKLPDPWMGKSVDGAANKQGIWTGRARADGEPKSFRIYRSADGACCLQGAVPGEMQLEGGGVLERQNFSVMNFVMSSGNA